VGPGFGLDVVAKRRILSPCRESNPGRPARNPIAIVVVVAAAAAAVAVVVVLMIW
jgi:hypothetical protein